MLIGRSSRLRPRAAGAAPIAGFEAVPVRRRQLEEARELVDAQPVEGIHVAALLTGAPTRRRALKGVWLVRDAAGLAAVAQHSRGVSFVLHPRRRGEPEVHSALARFVSRSVGVTEVMFGDEQTVRAVLAAGRPRGVAALEIRLQELLAAPPLARPAGESPVAGFRLRPAARDDLPWLLEAHAAMCREDLGVDQVTRNRDGYDDYFSSLIFEGRSIVGELDGAPVFKAELPVESDGARLVEGVFTLPRERGRGLAGWSMRCLAAAAARAGRTACLYVHRRNASARRVYRRAGFRAVCPWLTAMISRDGRVSAPPVEL